MSNPQVFVQPVDGSLQAAVARLLEPLASRVGGVRVLIKPNMHGGGGYTSMAVLEAVVTWALEGGAAEVVVGEGPYWGMQGFAAYAESIGAAQLCRRLGVKLVNFHDHAYDVLRPQMPALPETLGVTKWLAWADLSISVPVMKTHLNTLTTLAIKNLKGFIRPRDKRDIHGLDLHLAIAALPLFVKPDVHLLDATVAYEGMGPSSATPVDMGLLMASPDPFALDLVATWLMGIDPARVRYLREAERLGLGTVPADATATAALTNQPADRLGAWRRKFKLPYEAAAAEYPNLTITTDLACSGCVMNLFNALRRLKEQGVAEGLKGSVAAGKPRDDADLLVGSCTFAAWDTIPHVAGCPPTIDQISQALRAVLLER